MCCMVAYVKCAVQGYKLLSTKHSDFSEALEPSTRYSQVHMLEKALESGLYQSTAY